MKQEKHEHLPLKAVMHKIKTKQIAYRDDGDHDSTAHDISLSDDIEIPTH